MKYWTTPQLFERLLQEAGADGILVSRNKPARAVRFEFVKQGYATQEFNFSALPMMSGSPMGDEDDMCRIALMRYAYEARRSWRRENGYYRAERNDYQTFHNEYMGQWQTGGNPFFKEPPPRAQPQRASTDQHDVHEYMKFILEEINKHANVPPVKPQGRTTVVSAVDVSTGKECPVRELPRIEAPKDDGSKGVQ